MDKEILVFNLLSSYRLLKKEDKQDIIHKCYRLMRQRLQSYDCQSS